MPAERFNPYYEEEDDEDKPRKERRSWRPSVEPRPHASYQEQSAGYQQEVPPSDEVRRHAVAEAARRAAEQAMQAEDEPDDEDKESEKTQSEEPAAALFQAETTEPAPEIDAAWKQEEPETEAEAFRRIARELSQDRRARGEEIDPAVEEYLEQIAEKDSEPSRAEAEVIDERGLKQLEAEIEEVFDAPEYRELIEAADARIDSLNTDNPTDEEFAEIARILLDEESGAEPADTELSSLRESGLDAAKITNLADVEPRLDRPFVPPIKSRPPESAPPVTTGDSPPIPPRPPAGGGGGGGNGGGGPLSSPVPPAGGPEGLSAPALPAAPEIRLVRTDLSPAERAMWRRRVLTAGLLAGILGYYVGKRRGRRQQAAKMKPEHDKQVKENEQLRQEVLDGQLRIRSLERIKHEQAKALSELKEQPAAPPERLDSSMDIPEASDAKAVQERIPPRSDMPARSEVPAAPETARAARLNHQPVSAEQAIREADRSFQEAGSAGGRPASAPAGQQQIDTGPGISKPETLIAAPAAPESHRAAPERPPEALEAPTQFTPIEASSRPGRPPEFSHETPLTGLEAAPAMPDQSKTFESTDVEGMNLPELLTLAKEMTVGGVNLERLYSDNRIDKDGLRRLVAEYTRGGDPEKVLADEYMETRPRHTPEVKKQTADIGGPGGPGGSGGSGGMPASDHMLPAYHDAYPSEAPQHMIAAHDQASVRAHKHRRSAAVAVATTGAAGGIVAAIFLLG